MLYHAFLMSLLLMFGTLALWHPLPSRFDFWAHAAVGRWIWETGHVPDHTLFLWTASEPWIYHSWLSQLIFFGLTNVGAPEQLPYVVLTSTIALGFFPFFLYWLVCALVGPAVVVDGRATDPGAPGDRFSIATPTRTVHRGILVAPVDVSHHLVGSNPP